MKETRYLFQIGDTIGRKPGEWFPNTTHHHQQRPHSASCTGGDTCSKVMFWLFPSYILFFRCWCMNCKGDWDTCWETYCNYSVPGWDSSMQLQKEKKKSLKKDNPRGRCDATQAVIPLQTPNKSKTTQEKLSPNTASSSRLRPPFV